MLSAAILYAISGMALAQSTENHVAPDGGNVAKTLDNVIVTGARASGRTVESSAAPIDVLSSVDIQRANKANLLETLNTLLPSFNVPNVATPNVGSMIRAGQLRGLNPDHVLVLVNGKRRHSTAFLGAGGFSASAPADLSLIPSGAIQRIEVLRDGASAIYGSDAIAGVINIITNKDYEGGRFSYRLGQFSAGDGQTHVFKADAGFRFAGDGYLHVAAQVDDQEIVVRNSPVPASFLFYFPLDANGNEIVPAGNLSSSPRLPAGATPNPREATRDNNAWINQGHAPFRLETATVDIGKPLGDSLEAYSTLTWARRESSAPQNFRQPSRDEVVRAIHPDGFTPVEAIEEDDYEILLGLKRQGESGWDWDLSTNYGRNDIDIWVHNSINPTYGLGSQTSFFIGNLDYTAWTSNFDVKRRFEGGSIPLDVSFGAEYRREDYVRGHGDLQSYTHGGQRVLDGPRAGTVLGNSLGGSQALPGFRPSDVVDASRSSNSAYAGVSLELTDAWILDLAGRYERYSDFGNTSTGRLSTRYDFNDRFALRATVSNGFHAPALAALAYKNTGNMNTSVNHVLQVDSPEAIALGAKPLQPEKSKNYSVGIVAQPFEDVNLAVDFYEIEVRNRISQSTTFREGLYPGSGALVVAAGFGAQDGISYFINAADTRTRGVEVTLDGGFDLDRFGELRWSIAANYNDTDVTRIAPTPSVLAAYNIPVFSRGSQNTLRYLSPKDKQILGLDWTNGPWGIGLRTTRYGAIERFGNPTTVATTGPYAGLAEIPYDIGDLWVTDLDVNFAFSEKFRVGLAVNNLFGTKPSKLPAPLLAAHQEYSYTNNGPISAAGTFYSLNAEYRW